MSDADVTKKCSACGEQKKLFEFHKDAAKKLGVSSRCKPCAISATKLWGQTNRDKRNANSKQWVANNKQKRKEITRKYIENVGREEMRRRLKEWRAKNPEANRAAIARRRGKIAEAGGSFSSDDIKDLLKKQRGTCVVCVKKLPKSYHVDHIEPISKGGKNDKLNLQILCPTCNLKKNAKDPVEFMQSQGFLL